MYPGLVSCPFYAIPIYPFKFISSLKKVFITESARNKDKYHSSHTHSTDCCLQRWLPISPRGPSGHRGDRKDWSRWWRRRKEWSGAPRPGEGDPVSALIIASSCFISLTVTSIYGILIIIIMSYIT